MDKMSMKATLQFQQHIAKGHNRTHATMNERLSLGDTLINPYDERIIQILWEKGTQATILCEINSDE